MTRYTVTVRNTLSLVLAISQTVLSWPREGDVRLQGPDNTALEGRVEVYHEGAWLSVCDAFWDSREGDVVCKQLGFSGGAMSTDRSAIFGQGTSVSWLAGVTCSGDENSLIDCTGFTYGTGTCSHAEDVGVRCTYPMYQGCYTSSATGPLTEYSTESSNIDITRCLEICRDRDPSYTYAGIQQGMRCTCGYSLTASKQENSGCNVACLGDETEICGGTTTASIYKTGNIYSDANGGYLTSPNFPSHYTNDDAFDHTIMIPSAFNYAVVSFSYFKLASGDSVTLQAASSTTGNYPGGGSGAVPEKWISMSASTTFDVSFAVASGSAGDPGFVLEYKFGKLCYPNTLPDAVEHGTISSTQERYYYDEKVMVDCDPGYQGDIDGFFCQLNGTWSGAPICSSIPTTRPPPPSTTDVLLSTVETIEMSPGTTVTGPENPTGPSTAPGTPEPLPCVVPEVADGMVDPETGSVVNAGESIFLTCNSTFQPDGNTTATCLASGKFDEELACVPGGGLPAWLIAIIVVASVLALIVIVLVIMLMIISSEPKPTRRRRRSSIENSYGAQVDSPVEDRLVAIAPSVQQNPSARNSISSVSDGGGAVNQEAQTDADPALGEMGDPMVGDSDVYHPTRDYPGAGGGRRPPSMVPTRPTPVSPPAHPATKLPRQRSTEYHHGPADFSMLANEELLAVRALDNVVSDFERGDQGYFLGPSGPSPYAMDRGSRYSSMQIQFSQRSRLGSFYGLY